MEVSFRPVSFLFLFLAFLFLPNFFFFFCTGLLSELRCIHTERQALLNFKQHLIDPSNRLSSWTAHGDCCQWVGVVCHNLTAHVQQLHLRSFPPVWDDLMTDEQYVAQYEAYSQSMFGGKLNPSLLDLKYLNYFDISFNNFSASPIPSFLGSMKSLTSLNLSNAGFVGLIPHQLGNLSNLLYLNLHGYFPNDLYVNNLEWLSSLHLLQHLDMSSVNLSKASDWLQLTNTLPSLLELRLSYCQLPFIPLVVDVHNMTSLRHLDLSGNYFNSSIPNWLGNICNLREIKLSSNKWSQEISEILESLSGCLSDRLEILDLSYSQLHGRLTVELGVFKNLVKLFFEDNSISGPIPVSLGNLSSLTYLNFSNNQFNGTLPQNFGHLKNLAHLDLWNNSISGPIPVSLGNLSSLTYLDFSNNQFNGTLPQNFGHLKNLAHLDIWNNSISGPIPVSLGNLSSLTYLDFSNNQFNGTLPQNFGHLKNLAHLDLWNNLISGPIPEFLGNLQSLTYLDLSCNQFNGTLPQSFGHLKNLANLDLWNNLISGPIPVFLGNLQSLTYLDLSCNQFNGTLPQNFGHLKNLAHLDLWNNSISGPIPVFLGNLQSLTYLDLSYNQFNGTLPQSFGQLSKLEVLFINSNVLKGVVSEVLFANLTSLRLLDAGGNQLTLKASQNWIPPFQLETLSLQSWNLGPKFPQWLCSQRRMLSLDLSYTQISDMAPPSFWNLSSQFQYLNLSHNLINGEIPNSPVILFALVIDLSSNHFKGPLPCISSNVYALDLSNNSFSGSISHFFCFKVNEPKYIGHLNLQTNLLSGIIPDCLMNWNNLKVLNLRNNNFSGSIPASMGSLTYLHSFHLYNNTFSGKLPSSLKNCRELVIIDFAENRFAGNLPSWIGHRYIGLMILSLRSNYFHGHIPKELCALTSLQILDLSHNMLSGSIPRCVQNFSTMATNNISNDHLNSYGSRYGETLPLESALLVIKGNIIEYSTILHLVKSIDFSKNSLSGEIPEEVTNLQALQSLNLSYNLLNGSIPMNIGNMVLLESIDFSVNHLSGKIPSSMSSLTFLSHLNLSNNNLMGEIPLSTQLQSLAASSFIGNKLCGPPLMDNCTSVKPNNENTGSKDTNGLEVDWFYVSMALGFVVGFWVYVVLYYCTSHGE